MPFFDITKKNSPSPLYTSIALFIVFILSIVTATWRFLPWMPEVFFGDDLANLLAHKDGHFASSPIQALSAAFAEKYRPVFAWVMWFLFNIFDDQIAPFLVLNLLLHGLNSTLIFVIAFRLSRSNWILSLAITIVVASSRFALYQVTQVTGLVEGVSLTFFLGMIYCMVRASGDKEFAWRWSWLALGAAFLAIHTHERYIVIVIWLCFALIVLPNIRGLPRIQWFALLGACIALFLFNIFFKIVVLQMPVFVGTGGTHMDISLSRSVDHLMQAALSIFGFNEGPEYLVGARSISLNWLITWPVFAAISLSWLIAIVMGVRASFRNHEVSKDFAWQQLCWPFLLIALIVLLLAPPIITIRLEQRWLLAPFILILFVLAWAAGKQRQRPFVPIYAFALVISTASIAADSIIAPHFEQIFFVSSGRFAAATKNDIVEKDFGQSAPIGLLARQDHCNWSLLNGEFFRLYGGTQRKVNCFDSVDELFTAALPENTKIYGPSSSNLHLLDLSANWQSLKPAFNEKVSFDFLNAFPRGHINNSSKVDSPSGKGVMVIPWDTSLGLRNSLTIVSGFSFRYDAVSIDRNAKLSFGVSMTYPSRDPARAIVRIKDDNDLSSVLYSRDLVPPVKGEKLRFESVVIPLTDFAGKKVSITFSVETPGGDSSGHWVGFAAPRIEQGNLK